MLRELLGIERVWPLKYKYLGKHHALNNNNHKVLQKPVMLLGSEEFLYCEFQLHQSNRPRTSTKPPKLMQSPLQLEN